MQKKLFPPPPSSLPPPPLTSSLIPSQVSTHLNFWKVSGIVAGFVVTVLCLSRRTVLHTCHRAHVQLDQTLLSHLKCFLFAWPCVSISDYAVTRIYSGYALTGYCLQFDQVFLSVSHLPPLVPQGPLDSFISHTGLS